MWIKYILYIFATIKIKQMDLTDYNNKPELNNDDGITVVKKNRESNYNHGFLSVIREKLQNSEPGECLIVDRSKYDIKPESIRTMIGRLQKGIGLHFSVKITKSVIEIYVLE